MQVHLRPPISSWQRYRRDRCKEKRFPITSSNWTARKQKPEIAAPGACTCSAKLEVRNHGPLGTANNGVLPIRRGETERQGQGHVLTENWSLSSFCWRRLKSGSSVDGVATVTWSSCICSFGQGPWRDLCGFSERSGVLFWAFCCCDLWSWDTTTRNQKLAKGSRLKRICLVRRVWSSWVARTKWALIFEKTHEFIASLIY